MYGFITAILKPLSNQDYDLGHFSIHVLQLEYCYSLVNMFT